MTLTNVCWIAFILRYGWHAVQDPEFKCQHFYNLWFILLNLWVGRNLKLPILKCASPIYPGHNESKSINLGECTRRSIACRCCGHLVKTHWRIWILSECCIPVLQYCAQNHIRFIYVYLEYIFLCFSVSAWSWLPASDQTTNLTTNLTINLTSETCNNCCVIHDNTYIPMFSVFIKITMLYFYATT
jgi:hypothetical protein